MFCFRPGEQGGQRSVEISVAAGELLGARWVAERSRESILILDSAGQVLFANEAFGRQTGYSPEQIVGRSPAELLVGPETDLDTLGAIDLALSQGESGSFEWTAHHRDGAAFKTRVEVDPLGTCGFLVTFSNPFLGPETHASAILKGISEVVFERDSDHRWTYLNPAWEALTGFTVAESLGRPATEFVHPADATEKQRNLDRLGTEGAGVERSRVRFIRKDGEIKWVDVLTSFQTLADGTVVSRGTLKDVTETVQVLRAVKLERDFSEAVVQTAASLVMVLDSRGRILRFNSACEKVTGRRFSQVEGRDFTILLPEEARVEAERHFADLKSEDADLEFENEWVHRDGHRRRIRWAWTVLRDEVGNLRLVVASGQDVSDQHRAEEALRESKAQLDEAQALAHVGAWKIDYVSERVSWSPEMFRIHGLPTESAPPPLDSLRNHIHPEDVEQVLKAIAASQEFGVAFQGRFRIMRPTGEIRQVHSIGRTLRDSHGKVLSMFGSTQDVTEQAEAELALAKSQGLLVESQRIARLGSWELDLRTEQLTFTHQALELLGLSEANRPHCLPEIWSLLTAKDRLSLRTAYQATLTTGRALNEDVPYTRPDGERTVLHLRARLSIGSDGQPASLVGSIQDVTSQRLSDQLLETQRAFLRNVIDTSPNLIYVKDQDGRYVLANEAFAALFGMTPELLVGQRDADFNPNSEQVHQFDSMDQAVLKTGQDQIYQEELTDIWGCTHWLQTAKRPIRSPETGQMQVLGVSTDITDRVAVERQLDSARESALEASRLKSEFLANVSHEIRTPMNGVLGMAELLMESGVTPDQLDLVRTIHDCGRNLLGILNDILDFSKVEAGKMSLEMAAVDAALLLEDVAMLFARRIEEKGLTLRLHIDWEQPTMVRTDSGRLRQVLTNLVGNAVKFTDQGEIVLGLSALPDGSLRFSVEDSGIGIPEERREAIFESFTQADGSTTRRFGGTCLGLTIAKQLVEMLGGSMGLESEVGKGSVFTVDLPPRTRLGTFPHPSLEKVSARLDIQDPDLRARVTGMLVRSGARLNSDLPQVVVTDGLSERTELPVISLARRSERQLGPAATTLVYFPVTSRALEDAIASALGRPSISAPTLGQEVAGVVLLAEDNEVNRTVALRSLRNFAVEVRVAQNGFEAVEMVRHGDVDLVFMDVQMPVMDGFAATAAIREFESGSATRIPIIAMTAHAMAGDRERCLAAGMDGYLSKPIRKEELATILTKWLPNKMPMDTKQIDLSYLMEIAGDDLEFQRDVLSAYAEGLPPMLDELELAVGRGDRDVAYRVAHTLKGSSRSVGANLFAEICENAEIATKTGDMEAALREVRQAAELVLRECESFVPA